MDTVALHPALPLIPPASPEKPARPSLLRLLLRDHDALSQHLHDDRSLPTTVAKLIGMSIVGFALHGAAVGLTAQFGQFSILARPLGGHPVLWLPIALTLSMLGGLGICLPLFYFCAQMAGFDAPLRLVAAQALRANAASAAVLFGTLPLYLAFALAPVARLPMPTEFVLIAGALLPCAAGLWGLSAVYAGFKDLAKSAPAEDADRRRALLGFMVICAGLIYAIVTPIAFYRLSQALSVGL